MGISFTAHWHGLRCLELVAEELPSPRLFRKLADFAMRLRDMGLVDGAASSYRSLAVYWDDIPDSGCEEQVVAAMEQMVDASSDASKVAQVRVHEVPVRYDGIDLCRVAQVHAVSVEEVVVRHSSSLYTVAAIGFLPYFGYLWGLDATLVTPRLEVPRPRVPAGAVGIGGEQTGIYPGVSPGGWNLIGSVEENVCGEVCRELRVGDEVVFKVTG